MKRWRRVLVGIALMSVPGTALIGQENSANDGSPMNRAIRDLGGAVADFGENLWKVVSAPAGMDRSAGLQFAGVLAVGGVFFALDERIREEVLEAERTGLYGAVSDVGDFFEPVGLQSKTNLPLAVIAGAGYLTDQDWLHAPAKQLLYSQLINGIIRQGTGFAVGRQRPNATSDAFDFDPGDGKSFPSGHSAVIMSVATVLSHHLDWAPATAVLYGMAGSVFFQRVDSNEHWASDVWFGAALGYAVSRIVIHTEESRRIDVVAAPSPTGGMGLSLSIATN